MQSQWTDPARFYQLVLLNGRLGALGGNPHHLPKFLHIAVVIVGIVMPPMDEHEHQEVGAVEGRILQLGRDALVDDRQLLIVLIAPSLIIELGKSQNILSVIFDDSQVLALGG